MLVGLPKIDKQFLLFLLIIKTRIKLKVIEFVIMQLLFYIFETVIFWQYLLIFRGKRKIYSSKFRNVYFVLCDVFFNELFDRYLIVFVN